MRGKDLEKEEGIQKKTFLSPRPKIIQGRNSIQSLRDLFRDGELYIASNTPQPQTTTQLTQHIGRFCNC